MVAALADTGFASDTDSLVGGRSPVLVGSTVRLQPTRPSAEVFRRRRAVAAGALVTVLFGLFLGLQALFGQPGGGPLTSVGSPGAASGVRVWVVQPGDTLWSIAVASGARGDIRPFVARLSAEVGGQPLQPGERIVIPASEGDG